MTSRAFTEVKGECRGEVAGDILPQ